MISVLLLTRNRKAELQRCLESLEQQTTRDFEVVVVDNGSTDGTAEMLRQHTGCRIVRVENRAGGSFAEARNRGLDPAHGEIVAFIDDDCTAEPHWLEKIAHELQEVDAVGGLVLPAGNLRFPRWWHPELGWLVGLSVPGMLSSGPGYWTAGARYYAQTANMALRREILVREQFQEIGGDMRREARRYDAGREDAELWRRLRVKGFRVRLVPDLIVYHYIGQERLRLGYLLRRAYSDGVAYYIREQKCQYLSFACYDIVALPLRTLERVMIYLFREKRETTTSGIPGRTCQQDGKSSAPLNDVSSYSKEAHSTLSILAMNLLWGVRQAGFIAGYVRSGARVRRSISVGVEIGRQLVRHLCDTAKRPVRRAAVVGYRTFVMPRGALLPWKKQAGIPALPTPVGSILIVACGYLGDLILLQPSVRLLRRCLPEATLTLLTYPQGAELYAHGGPASAAQRIFSEILVCPPEQWGTWRQRGKLIAKQLGSRKFSVVVIEYYHGAAPEPLFLTARAPTIAYDQDIGFSRRLWYQLVSHPIAKNLEINEVLNSVQLLEPLGVKGSPEPYEFVIPEDVEARICGRLAADEIEASQLIVISPGAKLPAKQWPEEAWGKLAQMLKSGAADKSKSRAQIVFSGDQALAARLDGIINRYKLQAKNYSGTSLVELGALLRRARLLITPDSGAKHLAFALGTPTITLYGASDERRWGALWEHEKHQAVRACPFDLSAEELMGLPVNHQMRCITPELVMEHVEKAVRDLML